MPSRRATQTAAIVALLRTLPEDQLEEILGDLAAKGVVVREEVHKRARKRCGICGEFYPRCRQKWSGDHDYEDPDPTPTNSSSADASTPSAEGDSMRTTDPCPVGGFHAYRITGFCVCGAPAPKRMEDPDVV